MKGRIIKNYYFYISIINNVVYIWLITDTDDAVKKIKNTDQEVRAKAETEQDHAEGKPSSETLNKAKEKIKDALS